MEIAEFVRQIDQQMKEQDALYHSVAAAFGLSRNAVSQIKTRVERMIAAIEAEYGE